MLQVHAVIDSLAAGEVEKVGHGSQDCDSRVPAR
jgi:hypothetical protein